MSPASLTQSTGVPYTRIHAVGAARGDVIVPNDDIVGPIESSDEWIRQRTGVITRTRASANVQAVDLAEAASREAIDKAGISPSDIGAVIVSTISNTVQTPSLASLLTERIGATPAPAYDVSAACAVPKTWMPRPRFKWAGLTIHIVSPWLLAAAAASRKAMRSWSGLSSLSPAGVTTKLSGASDVTSSFAACA